jgi:hypothetical protein
MSRLLDPYASPETTECKFEVVERRPNGWVGFSIGAITISLLVFLLFTCACGHIAPYGVPIAAVAFALSVIGRWKSRSAFTLVAFGLCFALLAKSVADLLWIGHEPWFPLT